MNRPVAGIGRSPQSVKNLFTACSKRVMRLFLRILPIVLAPSSGLFETRGLSVTFLINALRIIFAIGLLFMSYFFVLH